jgi:hypothetical protein
MVIADGFIKPPRASGLNWPVRRPKIRIIPRKPVSRAAGSVRVALDLRGDDARAIRP